ncbi:hypothetical protein BSKO_04603 [Bryopsis sp. KO-2023]|nr:hypothetical protein BSKO_04603 [Bryopsis sp. KO-2023]
MIATTPSFARVFKTDVCVRPISRSGRSQFKISTSVVKRQSLTRDFGKRWVIKASEDDKEKETVASKTDVEKDAKPAAGGEAKAEADVEKKAAEKKPEKPAVEEKEKEEEPAVSAEDAYVESLKRVGLDKAAATKILDTWQETGVDSPDDLRRMFLKGSLNPLGVGVLQVLIDAGAAAGGFTAAKAFGSMPDLPFRLGVEAICYFIAWYFVSNVLIDLTTLGALLYSIVQFRTNTEAFMAAMEKIAQKRPGDLGVVSKARAAVDALKVVQALNTIADVLKETTTISGKDSASTLGNLSAYLVLVRAKEDFGFDPKAFNLSDDEATQIALQFCQYDLNDDGVLETRELGNLCAALGQTLTDDEVKAAMEIVDTDKSGVIEFDEFVDWWVNKVNPEKVANSENVENVEG